MKKKRWKKRDKKGEIREETWEKRLEIKKRDERRD